MTSMPRPAGVPPASSASSSSVPAQLAVRSPDDLLAAVPYLLGFHPSDSLVIVVLRERRVLFAVRADLPRLGASAEEIFGTVRHVCSVVVRQGGDAVVVVGYGAAERVGAVLPVCCETLTGVGLDIVEQLVVQDGRYRSASCVDPECCPPGGIPYDPTTSSVAAAATYAGQPVLPDRGQLTKLLAPVEGTARNEMRAAVRRAKLRLGKLLAAAPSAEVIAGRPVRRAGEAAVRALLDQADRRAGLSDDEVAWVTLLLAQVPVRDFAWRRITGAQWQLDVLSEVVRRADRDAVAAPASLLAFGAWRAGHGALANVALDRALRADPDYPMATLLRDALDLGLPPSLLDSWPDLPAPARRTDSVTPHRGHGPGTVT